MKFLDFFDSLKQQRLTPESKDLIFQRFEAKKRQSLFINKVNSYARTGVFSLCLLGLLAVVYFGSFAGDKGEREINDGFIGFNADENAQVAYADEVGTIITAVGEVSITNNGEKKSGTHLAHADKVLLLEGAELTFAMQGGVQAKIVGPAEFDLEKQDETYIINMINGEFVELVTVETDKSKGDDEQISKGGDAKSENALNDENDGEQNIEIVVKTAEFEISSDPSNGDIDLTISEQDGKQVVENIGTDVVITKLIKDEVVVTQLKSQQKAAINGEVHIANITPDQDISEDQAKLLAQNIKNNDLTISYKIEEDTEESEDISDESDDGIEKNQIVDTGIQQNNDQEDKIEEFNEKQKVEKVLAPEVAKDVPEQVVDKAEVKEEVPVEDTKRVIGGPELTALQNATHGSVLMRDISNLVVSHAYGTQEGVATSLQNLSASLGPVSNTILGGMNLNNSSPAMMANSVQALIDNLEAKRYVPPVYVNRLKSVIAWLRLVQTIPAGSVEITCNFDCIVQDVLKIQSHQKVRLMLQ